jgi:predicted naringenin-chalcone synthase
MSVYIHSVATAVPDYAYDQFHIRDVMKDWLDVDRRSERVLHSIYAHSGIETRYSVVPDLEPEAGRGAFFRTADGTGFVLPGTKERNNRYIEEAGPLFLKAARAALAAPGAPAASEITHVVTVSCTGFFAPGPDVLLVNELDLAPGTERYHVGFMGCYAAFPALRMARAFCRADPSAVVLVVSAELCTLHLQPGGEIDSMLAASVFADGAAAVLLASRPPGGPALRLDGFESTLAREGASEMAWTLGDTGFEMVLTSYVPRIVEARIAAAIAPLFERSGVRQESIMRWGVHPGGRAILDRVKAGLCLPEEALEASRWVLKNYGNMSSATVLFVLERMLAGASQPEPEALAAIAFGPGLTVESGLFTLLPDGA